MSRIFNDIAETIGNTPLVRLNRTAFVVCGHGQQFRQPDWINFRHAVKKSFATF
jgi:hypothetical protein